MDNVTELCLCRLVKHQAFEMRRVNGFGNVP